MRALALIAALVAADVCAAQPRPLREEDRRNPPPPAFALLPGGTGAGVSQIQTNLDQLFSSEMVGSWFALRGDGSTAGPLALSAVGSPSSQTDRVCPNGPDCAAVSSRRIDGTNSYFTTTAVDESAKSESGCAVVNVDSAKSNSVFVWSQPALSLLVRIEASGGITFYVAGVAATSAPGGSIVPGAVHHICWTYGYVGAGSVNRASVYVDGALKGSSAVAPVMGSASAVWTVGRRTGAPTEDFGGRIAGAFKTDKELSSAVIAAMATAVLPSLQGSRGETITTTRSTIRTCCNSAGCALLPANRPCLQGASLDVLGTRINTQLRSSEVDSASWTKQASVTVTADSATCGNAPDGTQTADLVDATAAGANTGVIGTNVAGVAGDADTSSVYLWRPSSDANCTITLVDGVVTSGSTTGSLTATQQRVTLTETSANTNRQIWVRKSSCNRWCQWGAQQETGSVATSYCPTTTASATCNGDQTTVVVASDWPVTTGSVAVTYLSPSGQPPADNTIRSLGSGTNGWKFAGGGSTIGFSCFNAGAGPGAVSPSLTWNAGQKYRIAASWTSGGTTTVYRDGAPLATAACQTIPNAAAVGAAANLFDNGTATVLKDAQFSDLCLSSSTEACR